MTPLELNIQLRADVRKILSAFRAERGVTVEWIVDHINQKYPYAVDAEVVNMALLWNLTARAWCNFRVNEITEVEEWFLTEKGRRLEGVK